MLFLTIGRVHYYSELDTKQRSRKEQTTSDNNPDRIEDDEMKVLQLYQTSISPGRFKLLLLSGLELRVS